MPTVHVQVEDELKLAIAQQAKQEHETPAVLVRRALRAMFLPDRVTIEQCAHVLVDTGKGAGT